jgi:hypothetical protein
MCREERDARDVRYNFSLWPSVGVEEGERLIDLHIGEPPSGVFAGPVSGTVVSQLTEGRGPGMDYRRIARVTGWLWIVTFVASIPARFIFYGPVLEDGKNYVLGDGKDAMTFIAFGALLELVVIIANIGTAVVPYSIHKRQSEPGALGYVTARVMESMFIAVGLLCMLAISTLRQDAPSGLDAALGQGLEAVYEWSFRLGPGFMVGVGNGLILGWLMYRSELVPRRLAMFGLIGGPLIIISGVLVMFDVIEGAGPVQAVMTIPEAFWEFALGVYLIVKGYRTSSPVLAGDSTVTVPDSPSAVREGP